MSVVRAIDKGIDALSIIAFALVGLVAICISVLSMMH